MKDKQQIWIEKWHITRLKSVFPWTQSRELLTAELYKNLQRAVSPSEKYFLGNKNLFERNNPSHNREIYDLFLSYVEVDPEQLPERFIELFELKGDKEEIKKQTLSLFKQARLLDKKSSRISFIDDKIVIFRTEEKLTHKNSERKLTRAEKNRLNTRQLSIPTQIFMMRSEASIIRLILAKRKRMNIKSYSRNVWN